MTKANSRKGFMEMLSFYLSFYFSDDESASILNDYEEWFENEAAQGKSEEEICLALEPPKKAAKNLFTESSGSVRISILRKNTMIQVILLMIIHLIISLRLLRTCNTNAYSFLYPALGINCLFFMIGTFIIKEHHHSKPHKVGSNLLIAGLAVLTILSAAFVLPKLNHPNSGVVCDRVLRVLSLILFVINFYVAVRKMFQDKQSAFLTILHISGVISLLFFIINQLHMFYDDNLPKLIYSILFGCIGIYAETVILCFIFYMRSVKSTSKSVKYIG